MSASSSASDRATFSKRSVFILAAIGSAIGLGSIWRFPYIAYENGGGAFLIPFLTALLTAGIPLLLFDNALGHRFRGGAPLSYRRIHRRMEWLGWVHVTICFIISAYYAVIIAWSAAYMVFSVRQRWGIEPDQFFFQTYLQSSDGVSTTPVPGVAIPLLLIWIITLGVLALGVQNGVGLVSKYFVPLLAVLFCILVVRSLFLPGAVQGLQVFFSADWSVLAHPRVWIAAYSQIFFSLSIGYGIMVTYSSYLKPRSDLAGSSMVVAFATSAFQVLAGICVFSALGFLALQQHTSVENVATNGIGLAFIAFPSVISEMWGGSLFGTIFFLSLVLAGLTSLVSLVEVVTAALQDKLGLRRVPAVLLTGIPLALLSLALFATRSGIGVLDIVDKFVNNYIVLGSLIMLVMVVWWARLLPQLQAHLNAVSSLTIGYWWRLCIGIITPLALLWMTATEFHSLMTNGYGDYPQWMLGVFGWGWLLVCAVTATVLSLVRWHDQILQLEGPMFTPEKIPEQVPSATQYSISPLPLLRRSHNDH